MAQESLTQRLMRGILPAPPPPPRNGERVRLPETLPNQPRRARIADAGMQALMGALGLADPLSETATPATGLGAILGMVGPAAMMGGVRRIANPIKAYHGSPHDFDRFDLSHVGSGMGGQARGFGHYLTADKKMGEYYRPAPILSGSNELDMGPASLVSMAINRTGSTDSGAVAKYLLDMADRAGPNANKDWVAAAQFVRANPLKLMPQGKLYEVNIHADPSELLNMDVDSGAAYRNVVSDIRNRSSERMSVAEAEKKASKSFRLAGVPGARYTDSINLPAGSKKTTNYVIWDESIIEILRKYGILPPLAAGAASQFTRPVDKPQGSGIR